jgi:hypothetical protein
MIPLSVPRRQLVGWLEVHTLQASKWSVAEIKDADTPRMLHQTLRIKLETPLMNGRVQMATYRILRTDTQSCNTPGRISALIQPQLQLIKEAGKTFSAKA